MKILTAPDTSVPGYVIEHDRDAETYHAYDLDMRHVRSDGERSRLITWLITDAAIQRAAERTYQERKATRWYRSIMAQPVQIDPAIVAANAARVCSHTHPVIMQACEARECPYGLTDEREIEESKRATGWVLCRCHRDAWEEWR